MPIQCASSVPAKDTKTEREVRAMTPELRLAHARIRELPYSEVCVHMRVAGQSRPVVRCGTMAQILNWDGSMFSFPVTRGEAGDLW